MKKTLPLFLIIFSFILVAGAQAGSGDNVSGWAWSENIGWISFNSTNCDTNGNGTIDSGEGTAGCPAAGTPVPNYGVNIEADGTFSGCAWSENIGWISFNSGDLVGCPSGTPQAVVDPSTEEVSGWARALSPLYYDGGGWDGWIKLREDTRNYGVWIDTSNYPSLGYSEFRDWAWGGDDTSSTAVVGWVSFNCVNNSWCATSSYKVITTFSFNQPPDKPTTTIAWSHCDIPGLSVPSFQWSYTDDDDDPLGTDPQTAYQIRIRGVNNFPVDALGNPIPTIDEFKCGSPPEICSGGASLSFSPIPSAWASSTNWNTDYWWTVRVKDNNNNWSPWSDPDPSYFKTPEHAYPSPNFDWTPSEPSVGEVVQLCATIATSTCDISELSVCYNASGPISQPSCSGKTFKWTLPSNAQFATGSTVSSENPRIIFNDLATENEVTLNIADHTIAAPDPSCTTTINIGEVSLPLPEWREVPPISWVKKIFASITDTFKDLFTFNKF